MKYLYFIIFQIFSVSIMAQSLTPVALTVGNSDATVSGMYFSQSIGQLAVTSVGANYSLTQGFLQPATTPQNIRLEPKSKLSVSVYPNPAHNIVYLTILQLEKEENFLVYLYDIYGRQVNISYQTQRLAEAEKITIQLPSLSAGTYFVKLIPQINNNNIVSATIIVQ